MGLIGQVQCVNKLKICEIYLRSEVHFEVGTKPQLNSGAVPIG